MFNAPFPTVLRIGAVNWLVFVGLVSGFMYMLCDTFGWSRWLWMVPSWTALAASSTLLLASLFFRQAPSSVKWRMAISGLVLFPVAIFFGVMGVAFIGTTPASAQRWLWLAVVGATSMWCLISLSSYKQRIAERRFIEREFMPETSRILVRQPLKTNLDPPPISEHTALGKLYHGVGPYLVMGIPMAYPIQRLLTDTGGMAAVLLLLAVLGLPLTIYILGRLTCGAYLWVYKVWQMERQYGKPVVFDRAD